MSTFYIVFLIKSQGARPLVGHFPLIRLSRIHFFNPRQLLIILDLLLLAVFDPKSLKPIIFFDFTCPWPTNVSHIPLVNGVLCQHVASVSHVHDTPPPPRGACKCTISCLTLTFSSLLLSHSRENIRSLYTDQFLLHWLRILCQVRKGELEKKITTHSPCD